MKKLIVICNGKSLQDFSFKSIDRKKYDIVTIGLSFRYFNKINFYPDYYVNVDSVCEKMVERDICKLIKNDKVKRVLLTSSCLWSDESVKIITKFKRKVDIMENIQKVNYLPFKYMKTVSSGSCAVLYGMLLGYTSIHILGADQDYKEMLIQSKKRPDGTLEITRPIEVNPNYFFNDYQREGDVYNKPNKNPGHHKRAWEEVKQISRIIEILHNIKVSIVNYNTKYSLSDLFNTLKYEELFS